MTVRLRPHHLLCLLTYIGRGYGEAFTRNYDAIARRLSEGEHVMVVDGPDDICAPLLEDPAAHCRKLGIRRRDEDALRDLARIVGCGIGDTLVLDEAILRDMRAAFAAGRIRHACTGCEWNALCSTVARDGFTNARVRVAATQARAISCGS